MSREEELVKQNEALRDRLSKLSEASLRINQSLDFDAVLQGVLDSARTLTGARYAVVTLLDASGRIQDCLSSGFSTQEAERLWGVPEGSQFFDYLNAFSEPLRIPDLFGYLRSLGIAEFQAPIPAASILPFLSAPVVHRDERVGNFFLAREDRGHQFTREDEEILVMFASQAALVIANARRYREEQRAKADLETLINTSPVGVVVFDITTGHPVMFNQEAARIMGALGSPDQPVEHLLESMTVRRADGQEISLEEISLPEAFSSGETVRTEEVVFQVPDGRSLTTLMNATPVRSEAGDIETYVVTLEDLERMRAEFLAMVSHELRTPLATVKGSVATLLQHDHSLAPAEARQFYQIIDAQSERMRALITDLLDVARIETGNLPVTPEPTDLAVLAAEVANAFRISGHRHNLQVDIPRSLPWVMADRSRMAQVLGNLLSNAARHSPETSTIRVTAVPGVFHVSVSVSDDGKGIDAESLPRLFRKFTSFDRGDRAGDTGLGLAICKGIVEAHGGRIWAESDGPDLGARFIFTIPTAEEAGFVSPPPPSGRGSGTEQFQVLIVDDDPQALKHIRDALASSSYACIAASNPDDALRLAGQEKPHLVLLDLMLPGTGGIDLMAEIKDIRDVPVIFVSAYGQDWLIARAFQMGADDYVVKPFSPTELAARVGAALRRRAIPEPAGSYVAGDLAIDYEQCQVSLRGQPVPLTATQYRLLAELSANAGQVLTYEQLLSRVWAEDQDGNVRAVRTMVSAIRRKLADDPADPAYIFNRRGLGYSMPRSHDDAGRPPRS